MRPGYWWRRLVDAWSVRSIGAELSRHLSWDGETLRRYQDDQLRAMVAHARRHSPFYRDLYKDLPSNYQITDLPILDKEALLSHFDAVVVDPRLQWQALQAHLAALTQDAYFLGRYRVVSSSGTTGRITPFVFNRREWNIIQANRWRTGSLGRRASSRRRQATALLLTGRPASVSVRSAMTMGLGETGFKVFDFTKNRDDLVRDLNAYQPTQLVGYASTLALLAQEQCAGRLCIRPEAIVAGAELLTDAMMRQIEEAWSIRPQQTYGMTESPSLGFPCPVHPNEIHLCEDLTLIENVDAQDRPVPDGVLGDSILITNLYNQTQPLIRYRVSDRLLIASGPCACGVPFRRLRRCHGRTDDLLVLPGLSADSVTLEPMILEEAIERVEQVLQFQVVYAQQRLTVRLVTSCGPDEETRVADAVCTALRRMFANRLAQVPVITVEVVSELRREAGGKLRLIVSPASS